MTIERQIHIFTEYAKGTDKIEIAAALNAKGLRFNGKLFKGCTFDKDYRRQIIDNLVTMVYIHDDEHIKLVNYLTFWVDKSIERVRPGETNEEPERLKGVQTQSTIVHHNKRIRTL